MLLFSSNTKPKTRSVKTKVKMNKKRNFILNVLNLQFNAILSAILYLIVNLQGHTPTHSFIDADKNKSVGSNRINALFHLFDLFILLICNDNSEERNVDILPFLSCHRRSVEHI